MVCEEEDSQLTYVAIVDICWELDEGKGRDKRLKMVMLRFRSAITEYYYVLLSESEDHVTCYR